jgi:hypothetical protein
MLIWAEDERAVAKALRMSNNKLVRQCDPTLETINRNRLFFINSRLLSN